jgi:hypothetical protein
LNAELRELYKHEANEGMAPRLTRANTAGLEAAANSLREGLYKHLEAMGEQTPAEFHREYGALKQMARVFDKRATVDERQAPMNLAQTLSFAGGAGVGIYDFLMGNPLRAVAATVPLIATSIQKARQAPASLIRQGLREQLRTGPGIVGKAGQVLREVLPAIGAQYERSRELGPPAPIPTEEMVPQTPPPIAQQVVEGSVAVGPQGHRIRFQGGQWVDAASGQPFRE